MANKDVYPPLIFDKDGIISTTEHTAPASIHDKEECKTEGKKGIGKTCPKINETYWFIRTRLNGAAFDVYKHTWIGSQMDFIRMVRGNVYSDEKKAWNSALRMVKELEKLKKDNPDSVKL